MRNLTIGLLLLSSCGDTSKESGLDETSSPNDTQAMGLDADGDGVAARDDCDDSDASIYPGAVEICDEVDNDCDGLIDGPASTDALTWYSDGDGDGYGTDDTTVAACDPPAGFALHDGDCDDADPAYYPGALESDCTDPNDYNCDGSVGFEDADADGFAACEDCDDADGAVNEDAVEICDLLDNDCNGLVDSADPGVEGTNTYYGDADGDGYGGQQFQESACEASPGFVTNSDDCDDVDPLSYPGATEICDDSDNDCDNDVDEGVGTPWYADADGDGYGDASQSVEACDSPAGYVANQNDCDDSAASTSPASFEICDGQDNNCDGSVDENAINATTFYVDVDGDGYGSTAASTTACDTPTGYADNDSDCNDAEATIYPAATELCDGQDNACTGSVPADETDDDADGFVECTIDSGGWDGASMSGGDDCNDAEGTTYPGATESCDGVDNDCDAATEAGDGESDDDSDGAINCDDCDDNDATVFPGAAESCDDVDHDCDGVTDFDVDGDGFSDELCGGSDCDDADATLFPDAAGVCAICGDSLLEGDETCDDGGVADGDGCSSDCLEESNSSCNGEPSVCVTDAEPDSFSFVDETYAEPNTSYDSNEVTLSGFIGDLDVTVSSAEAVSIIKNGTDTGGTATTVQEGDTVGIRMSSLGYEVTVVATLTAGTVQEDWELTTRPDEVLLGNGTRVFITDGTWNGNLGGVAGADNKCQLEADAVAKYAGGTYKAWLGAGGSYPSTTFVQSTTPYMNYESGYGWRTVANDWTGLTTQNLLYPVYYTPTDQLTDGSALSDANRQGSAAGTPVWHNPASHVGGNCGGWTSSAGGGGSFSHAHGVDTTKLDDWWADVQGHSQGTICNNGCWYCGPPYESLQRLLCFEQ